MQRPQSPRYLRYRGSLRPCLATTSGTPATRTSASPSRRGRAGSASSSRAPSAGRARTARRTRAGPAPRRRATRPAGPAGGTQRRARPVTTSAARASVRAVSASAPRSHSRAARTSSVESASESASPSSSNARRGAPREGNLERERAECDPRQPARASGHERERERDRDPDGGDHPRAESDDEAPELLADLAAVGVAQHTLDHGLARDRERARGRADEREREPGGRDDVAGGLARAEPRARQRDGGHDPERAGGHRHERRRGEIRVDEGRRGPLAEPRREREADHVQELERERQRRADGECAESRTQRRPARTHRSTRHPFLQGTYGEPDRRNGHGDRAVQGHSPGDGDDSVRLDAHDDERQPGDAPGRVADGRGRVVVERREAAGRERGEEMGDRRRADPEERVLRGVVCGPGALAGQERGDQVAADRRQQQERDGDDGDRDGEPGELAGEPLLHAGLRELG